MPWFDYEDAEQDIIDNGGDPDYLSHFDPDERDEYLRKMGLRPEDYGGSRKSSSKSHNSSSSDSGGCFLTSACAEAKGLPDDCEELTILRHYRDTYLSMQIGGKDEIQEYYKIAPQIVESINAKENAKEIWNSVYEEMVLPCVRMIKSGNKEDAFRLYKSYTLKLASI